VKPHLAIAVARRHATAESRAIAALNEMTRRGDPITFAAVARTASVSTDFLYRHPDLRPKIESLRRPTGERATRARDSRINAAAGTSSAVRMLSAQIKRMRAEHQAEVAALQRALAAAEDENLRLRRGASHRIEK
jgi:hypothetical protein